MQNASPKEIERQLGARYAQLLQDTAVSGAVYRDCQEVIETSLNVLQHYNKISLAIRSQLNARKAPGGAFAQAS